jgi:hypothetical protein
MEGASGRDYPNCLSTDADSLFFSVFMFSQNLTGGHLQKSPSLPAFPQPVEKQGSAGPAGQGIPRGLRQEPSFLAGWNAQVNK